MKKSRIVVSLPNDNLYQHEQELVAKSTGERLGLDVQVLHAGDDAIAQSQQVLQIIHSSGESTLGAIIVEPVSATGLRRVAEVAVEKGIAWVISNGHVDYIQHLRKSPQVPVFTVTQGQHEIGQLQGKQFGALLPQGGAVLYIEGPNMSTVAVQRREGMESARPQNIRITTIRGKWTEEGAYQSTAAWLRLATSRAEKFDLVAGQTHELTLGAKRAFQKLEDPEQKAKWLGLPCIGNGIASQAKPLVDQRVFVAAVITSVTMDLALRMLVRALDTQVQPPDRNVAEMSSYPDLDKLRPLK